MPNTQASAAKGVVDQEEHLRAGQRCRPRETGVVKLGDDGRVNVVGEAAYPGKPTGG